MVERFLPDKINQAIFNVLGHVTLRRFDSEGDRNDFTVTRKDNSQISLTQKVREAGKIKKYGWKPENSQGGLQELNSLGEVDAYLQTQGYTKEKSIHIEQV